MGKLIRGMDYRERGHRSGYEFVMLPRPFFIQNFEILSFRAILLVFPSIPAYAIVRAPGGNLGKGNLIYNDACLSKTVVDAQLDTINIEDALRD